MQWNEAYENQPRMGRKNLAQRFSAGWSGVGKKIESRRDDRVCDTISKAQETVGSIALIQSDYEMD